MSRESKMGAVRITSVALVITMLLMLGACGKSNGYALREENGEKYIYLDGVEYKAMLPANYHTERIEFDSKEDLVNTIQTGGFTDEELEKMRFWIRVYGEPILVPNFDSIPLLNCPDEYSDVKLTWGGGVQWNYVATYEEAEARVYYSTEDLFEQELNFYADFVSNGRYIVKEEKDTERNAVIYHHTYGQSATDRIPDRWAIYSFKANGSTFYVREEYKDKAVLPNSMIMYIKQADGKYVYVSISRPTDRYSIEWLSAFELVTNGV